MFCWNKYIMFIKVLIYIILEYNTVESWMFVEEHAMFFLILWIHKFTFP